MLWREQHLFKNIIRTFRRVDMTSWKHQKYFLNHSAYDTPGIFVIPGIPFCENLPGRNSRNSQDAHKLCPFQNNCAYADVNVNLWQIVRLIQCEWEPPCLIKIRLYLQDIGSLEPKEKFCPLRLISTV